MDSLFTGMLTRKMKQQICNIVMCKKDKMKIIVLPVEQQSNGIDCGVYAIAFITSILHGKLDFSLINYDEMKMRSHMMNMLVKNRIKEFPNTDIKTRKARRKLLEIDLYCSCCQIWLNSDGKLYSK